MADKEVLEAPVVPAQDEGAVDVLARLESAVAGAGSAKAWAVRAGLSPVYVGDVRRGLRTPGPAVLRALGLTRVVSYRDEEVRS